MVAQGSYAAKLSSPGTCDFADADIPTASNVMDWSGYVRRDTASSYMVFGTNPTGENTYTGIARNGNTFVHAIRSTEVTGGTEVDSTWYWLEVQGGTGDVNAGMYDFNHALNTTLKKTGGEEATSVGQIFTLSSVGAITGYFDNLAWWKHINSPPTATFGAAQLYNSAPDMNVVYPTANGIYFRGGATVRIDLNVSDVDNNAVAELFDLNYNTSAAAGGTVIIDDGNVASTSGLYCDSNSLSPVVQCHYNWTVPLIDGNRFISADVSDGSGSKANFSANSFYIDSTAPSTTSDANSTVWQNHDANVALTCSDAGACGTTKYRVDTDDTNIVAFGAWTTYSTRIGVSRDGNFAIDFNSTDVAGNIEATKRAYVLIDKNAALTSSDANTSSWQAFAANVALTCTDVNSGCASTKYRVDSDWNSGVTTGAWTAYSARINFPNDGNWALDFNSTDVAGNVEATKRAYVLIDANFPVTSSDFNSSTWQRDVNGRLTCSDSPGSGCALTQFRLDTDPTSAISMGAWQNYDANIQIQQDGNFAIDFNSTDAAGHAETTQRTFALRDHDGPVIAAYVPGATTTFSATSYDFSASGHDSNGTGWRVCNFKIYNGIDSSLNSDTNVVPVSMSCSKTVAFGLGQIFFAAITVYDDLNNTTTQNTSTAERLVQTNNGPSGGGGGSAADSSTTQVTTFTVLAPTAGISLDAYPGFSTQILFKIKNETNSPIKVSFAGTQDVGGFIVPMDPIEIVGQETKDIVVSIQAPKDQVLGKFSGKLNVSDGKSTAGFDFGMDVQKASPVLELGSLLGKSTFGIPNIVLLLVFAGAFFTWGYDKKLKQAVRAGS